MRIRVIDNNCNCLIHIYIYIYIARASIVYKLSQLFIWLQFSSFYVLHFIGVICTYNNSIYMNGISAVFLLWKLPFYLIEQNVNYWNFRWIWIKRYRSSCDTLMCLLCLVLQSRNRYHYMSNNISDI